MIFLIFLVSLGTIHVILAADEKQKRERTQSRRVPMAMTPVAEEPSSAEATPGVWNLLRAVEEHGRGEKPGTEVPKVPTVTKASSEDC